MSFDQRVYEVVKTIPKGKVATYKAVADKLGSKAYRAVGQALNRNTNSFCSNNPHIPCHRVIASDGNLGGFAFGQEKKIQLLKSEGVRIIDRNVDETCILREL